MEITNYNVETTKYWPMATRHDPRLSEGGNVVCDYGLPSLYELAKARRIFAANAGAGTALISIAAIPGTGPKPSWGLYNGYTSAFRRHLAVLQINCHSVSNTATGLGIALIAGLATAPQAAAYVSYASSVTKPVSGGGGVKGTQAVFCSPLTEDVALAGDPVWVTLAARHQVAAASVGTGLTAGFGYGLSPDGQQSNKKKRGQAEALFLIPPQYCLGIEVLAPIGASSDSLFNVGVVWAEVDVDLA